MPEGRLGRTGARTRVTPGFGQRVYDLTIAKRRPDGKAWSTTDLAAAMGVTPSAARSYFAGTVPRGKNLRKLADALGANVDQLLSDNQPSTSRGDQHQTPGGRMVPTQSGQFQGGAGEFSTEETPDAVMSAFQKWVADYFATEARVPAALATQWMARMWQAKSISTSKSRGKTPDRFSPGQEEAAVLVGPEGEMLAVSEQLCTMLGVREEDVVGMLGCEFAASEEDADLLRQSMLSPLKTPTDLMMKHSSGQGIAVTAYPSNETGGALQVTFLPRGRRRGWPTKELPGILVATMDGRIALVNDRLAGLYGMTREQIQGRYEWELVVPEMRTEAKNRILTCATGPTRWPVCKPDGTRMVVDALTTIEVLNDQPMRVTRGWEAEAGGTSERKELRQSGMPQHIDP